MSTNAEESEAWLNHRKTATQWQGQPKNWCHRILIFIIQGVSENNAQSFTHDKFETVCCKMKIFAPKCSSEITVYQSAQNLCKWVKYSLLNSRKQLHVCRTMCRRTDRYARQPSCKQIVSDFVEPGHLAHLIWICGLFNFGCCLAAGVSSEIHIYWPSETSPKCSCWEIINQELINGATDSGLKDCCWSLVSRVDNVNIVFP